MSGELCVMTYGAALTQLWCADNWDTLLKVSTQWYIHLCKLVR